MRRLFIGLLMLAVLVGTVYAQVGGGETQGKLTMLITSLQTLICQILPMIMLLAVLLAALIYAAGQLAPADMRARFGQWASGLIVGAITAGVIYIVLPYILQMLVPNVQQSLACPYR